MTDHTPSPATDGLREAIEGLLSAALSPDAVVRELHALLAAYRRTVTEFAPIVGEWEPVEETQP